MGVENQEPKVGERMHAAFLNLRDVRQLAVLLEVEYSYLTYLLYRTSPSVRYTKFQLPKRKGGHRLIMVPFRGLKLVQQRLARILEHVYRPPPAAHGFVARRGIVSNAEYHTKRQFVLNVDLKDFFPSINFGRVRGMFMAKPYSLPASVATVLAQICCCDNQLPQGAPTSPIVSNMLCRRLDRALHGLARDHRCRYTRYADDITFSTNLPKFPEGICLSDGNSVQVGTELLMTIERSGFAVNPAKVWVRRWDVRQEVTGLVVNRKVNVPRRAIRQVRAMLHAWERYGLEHAATEHYEKYRSAKHRTPSAPRPSFPEVVKGKIAYIRMVKGEHSPVVENLDAWCKALLKKGSPARQLDIPEKIRNAMWVIEQEEEAIQGTAFDVLDVGVVTCAHVLGDKSNSGSVVAFRHGDSGRKYKVTILHRDDRLDLALLRIADGVSYPLEMDPTDTVGDQANIILGGFPNYRYGDTGTIKYGRIVGHRRWSGTRRALIDAHVVAGNSGGPVTTLAGVVIGIAVTGAESPDAVGRTEDHGVIPISEISFLLDEIAKTVTDESSV